MRLSILLLLAVLLKPASVYGQLFDVYNDTTLTDFYVTISQARLDSILFGDPNSDIERLAKIKIVQNGKADSVENAGFRLRGNTSRTAAKKSFKVSINTFTKGQRLLGYKDFNLNGEHNDPSLIRAKLVWDLFTEAGLPSTRAAHVRLFINGEFFGIYLNVEHVNDDFLQRRYGNQSGNLYKCVYPADLVFIDQNPDSYKFLRNGRERAYELKTNEDADDYRDLADFIGFINNSSTAQFTDGIESRFNVDGFLRYLAVCVLTGNWDSYWYLKNNFYLYNNPTDGRFDFLPYDVDNTLGVDWVGQNWSNRNLYTWGHTSEARPLASRILAISKYKERFSWYISRYKETIYTPEKLRASGEEAQALLTSHISTDPYYPRDYNYNFSTFQQSLQSAAGGHVKFGIVPFVTARNASAATQLQTFSVAPFLKELFLPIVVAGRSAEFRFTTGGPFPTDSALVFILLGTETRALKAEKRSENAFAVLLPTLSEPFRIRVQLYAEAGKTGHWPSSNTANGHLVPVVQVSDAYPLRLNEFLADNATGLRDEAGDLEDWIEIVNPGTEAVSLAGYYLTDTFTNPGKWAFPNSTLGEGVFQVIFADEEAAEGPFHAGLKLSRGGEQIGLYFKLNDQFILVDSVKFGAQTTDFTRARSPDATGEWVSGARPTPGFSNATGTRSEISAKPDAFSISSYPNPFNGSAQIHFSVPEAAFVRLTLIDISGRVLQTLVQNRLEAGNHRVSLRADGLSTGVYFVRVEAGATRRLLKVALVK